MIASDGAPTFFGSITWKPWPPAGAPSPWIETATSAWAALPMAARLSTHGPTPVLSVRVMTTLAPAALSRACGRSATSKVNAASWYPLFVSVPVVSQAFMPVPIGTSLLMISGWAPLPPSWPGSMTIVLPDTACRSSGPVTGTAGAALAGPPDGDAAEGTALPGPAAAGVPGSAQCAATAVPGPQPASRARPAMARNIRRRRAGTRLMLLTGRCEHDLCPRAAVAFGHDRQYPSGRVEHRVRCGDTHRRQRSAVGEYPRLVGGRLTPGEEPGGRLVQRQRHRVVAGGQLVQRHGLVQPEAYGHSGPRSFARRPGTPAHEGPAQRGQVPADAQGRAEIPGQRPHIGTRRAVHRHVKVHQVRRAAHRQQVEAGHGDLTGGEAHVLPGAYPGVGAQPPDLDRAHRTRYLGDVAGQVDQPGPDRRAGHVPGRPRGNHGTLGVVGHRRLPEPDRRPVPLLRADHIRQQSGRPADADHEYPGRHRVERATVPDPPGLRQSPYPRHHVVRGDPGRLVDDDQSGRLHAPTLDALAAQPPARGRAPRRGS